MKIILLLAFKSLHNRKFSVALTLLSIGLSVTLLLGVERIRTESRASFTNTVSGTDLVVGARSGPIQLLLYAVFRIGNATNNISWQSYQEIAQSPEVEWTIPISLGDSHKGYRVMGTSASYFNYFQYGTRQPLEFDKGKSFHDLYEAVLGYEAAQTLGYQLGDAIIIAHGAGEVSFVTHDDKPFIISGILKPTGTPVDRTIHVSLEAIEAIHVDWKNGAPVPGRSLSAKMTRRLNLTPHEITAFLVKLKSPIATFGMQRKINRYKDEPLTAILPGVALQQLWQLIGVAEKSLLIVSGFVVIVGLLGMLTALLTSLNERRREMAILRSVGARPLHVFSLIIGEAALTTSLGIGLGVILLYALLSVAHHIMVTRFGVNLSLGILSLHECAILGGIWLAGLLAGILPGWRIYHYSLIDGLTVKV